MVLSSTEFLERYGFAHKIREVSGESMSKCCLLSWYHTVNLPCKLGNQRIERIVLANSWECRHHGLHGRRVHLY